MKLKGLMSIGAQVLLATAAMAGSAGAVAGGVVKGKATDIVVPAISTGHGGRWLTCPKGQVFGLNQKCRNAGDYSNKETSAGSGAVVGLDQLLAIHVEKPAGASIKTLGWEKKDDLNLLVTYSIN